MKVYGRGRGMDRGRVGVMFLLNVWVGQGW